jgi:hypothetical protein
MLKQLMSLIAGLTLVASVFAQGTGTIDGKKNPEKIPEALAYFMYFNHVGYALDNEAKNPLMVSLLLQGTGLNEVEQSVLKQTIVTHQINQRILENKRNSDVMTGTETADSVIAYRTARMKYTMDAVNSVLTQVSPEGAIAFKKFIQAFKANLSMDEGMQKQWQN